MKKVLSYLKSEIWIIAVCILLLLLQAYTELSLPNYMSDIVNIGIQQSGIDDTAPAAMSKDAMELLSCFLTEDDYSELSTLYTLESEGKKVSKLPLAASTSVYVLNENADLEKAESIFSGAVYGLIDFVSSQEGSSQEASSDQTALDIKALYSMTETLKSLPEGALDKSINSGKMADSAVKSQYSTAFIKMLYSELNADLSDMQTAYIIRTGILMLLITILGVICAISVGFFASRLGAKLSQKLRYEVFKKVENFSLSEFDKFSTASLITRTTNDITQIQMLITMGLRMVCYAPIMGIGGIIMALNKSPSLSWIIAVAVIVLIGVILIIFAIAMPKFKSVQKLIDRLNLVTRENLSGMMVIRAFGNQKLEEERFEKSNDELTKVNLFINRVMAFMFPCMMFIMSLTSIGVVWFGAKQINAAKIQVGDMLAFMQYGMQIIGAFLMIAMMFIMIPRAAVSASRIAEVLETEPAVKDPVKPFCFENRPHGVITFDKVSFSYPNSEDAVLHNISFTANPGETTAFIGSTGSGKSTLIKLIPRFYDVTKGEILIDGVNIKDISQDELRHYIGFVPQKAVLFSGDIEGAIRYGKEDASQEKIELAAKIAQADGFISEKPDGYSSPISQGGGNVSGGQKQRLAIARAIVRDVPIYIFDDSFSALDFKTDAALRRALSEHTQNASVLIVAQRVSTIMHAEKIVVLDEGKVVGIGTHRQLLAECPVYREIASSQLSEEELQ